MAKENKKEVEDIKKVPNGIVMYYHCNTCLKNNIQSNLAFGPTPKGYQLWCDNCNKNVLAIDLRGQLVVVDREPNKPFVFANSDETQEGNIASTKTKKSTSNKKSVK